MLLTVHRFLVCSLSLPAPLCPLFYPQSLHNDSLHLLWLKRKCACLMSLRYVSKESRTPEKNSSSLILPSFILSPTTHDEFFRLVFCLNRVALSWSLTATIQVLCDLNYICRINKQLWRRGEENLRPAVLPEVSAGGSLQSTSFPSKWKKIVVISSCCYHIIYIYYLLIICYFL